MAGRDVETDPEGETRYECLICGTVVVDTSHPTTCPDCDSVLRNRATPCE
jgi:rubrerythrin